MIFIKIVLTDQRRKNWKKDAKFFQIIEIKKRGENKRKIEWLFPIYLKKEPHYFDCGEQLFPFLGE